jgi:arylsulfatase A-like enzyme
MKVMSNTRRLLGDQGTTFDKSFVSLPLCCPSRATFLTGQYAHNHRVLSNSLPTGGYAKLDNRSTLAVWLSKAGYHTAFAGKYLNGYASTAEEGGPLAAPPGWRDWYADAAEGQYSYFDYQVNHNRRLIEFGSSPGDYRTDVLSRRLNSVIRVHAGSSKPLFLWAAFLSPHRGKAGEGKDMGAGPVPAPRHAGRFASVTLPMPASFNEADVSDKPASVRDEPPLEREDIERLRQTYAQQLESLLAVDEAVRSAVTALRQTGRLANTLIIFTSDNGYLNGAHRKLLKGLPYEPSIRVPLILRGPSVPAGQHRSQLVANVDLAPTILDAARVRPGRVVDGISVLPLARNPRLGEDRVLLLEGAPQSESDVFEFVGVRTARYKYIEWRTGEKELYDLKRDPDELASRAGDRAVASVQSMLAGRLRALRQCRGPSCRAVRAP